MKFSKIYEIKKQDFFLILLSCLPIWFLEDKNFLNFKIFLFFLVTIIILYLAYILFFILKTSKANLLLSLIIFYGLDSKISFWIFFENLLSHGWQKYLFSFLFVVFLTSIIYLFLEKSSKSKKIFISSLVVLFIINLLPTYSTSNFYLLENLKVKKKNITDQKKTIIIHLDEMVGYHGIDENVKFGKLAKSSYEDLFSKNKFKLYASAYSIYNNTVDSIPNLLNFDFNTTKNYISKYNNYVRWNSFDRKSKWKVVNNKFFENNKLKKIIASKEQSADFCYKFVSACLHSNHINLYGNYIDLFEFNLKDYIFKKSYNQKSIFFHYFWRLIKFSENKLNINIFNDYHFFVFHKVKFENDLNNLVKLISNTDFDIYFTHLIFPHKPFIFEYDKKLNKCYFKKQYIDEFDYNNTKSLLTQHYKEIICTNIYLKNFFYRLKLSGNFDNYDILLISDTGTITQNKTKNAFLRDNYSVLYARKSINNQEFQINNEFVSSQELFSRHYNDSHNATYQEDFKTRVHLYDTNEYVEVKDFMDY